MYRRGGSCPEPAGLMERRARSVGSKARLDVEMSVARGWRKEFVRCNQLQTIPLATYAILTNSSIEVYSKKRQTGDSAPPQTSPHSLNHTFSKTETNTEVIHSYRV
jgi:hypothetical protein